MDCCKLTVHKKCIDIWLENNNNCPKCRRKVIESECLCFNDVNDKIIDIGCFCLLIIPLFVPIVILSYRRYSDIYTLFSSITNSYYISLYLEVCNTLLMIYKYRHGSIWSILIFFEIVVTLVTYHIFWLYIVINYTDRNQFYKEREDHNMRYSIFIITILYGVFLTILFIITLIYNFVKPLYTKIAEFMITTKTKYKIINEEELNMLQDV